jgi:mandelonitrile lyase
MWHYRGICVMGKVVDIDYHVLGTNALCVIDSSTFKNSPRTNPQATVMMFGWYVHANMEIPNICLGFVA